jgi:hypothetical protein
VEIIAILAFVEGAVRMVIRSIMVASTTDKVLIIAKADEEAGIGEKYNQVVYIINKKAIDAKDG